MQRVQGIPRDDRTVNDEPFRIAARVSDEQAVLGNFDLAIGRNVERAVPIEGDELVEGIPVQDDALRTPLTSMWPLGTDRSR